MFKAEKRPRFVGLAYKSRQRKTRQFSFTGKNSSSYILKLQCSTGTGSPDLRMQRQPRYFYSKSEGFGKISMLNNEASLISYTKKLI